MVRAALYRLVLIRAVGEYRLPEGAAMIACGNRETDLGMARRMPTPLASRFVHFEIRVDAGIERALFRSAVSEAAYVEFSAFLRVWCELPHSKTVLDDPENASIPDNSSALIALCGALYRLAEDISLDAIITCVRREIGKFLVSSCIRRDPALLHSPAFIRWAAAGSQ